MRYGLSLPNFGEHAYPRALAELAQEAEAAGWDGLFLWDHVIFWPGLAAPVFDPWVALAAVATVTSRIRVGAMVTPLARRRPWQVAREVSTLDHLSSGRVIVGVGLGDPVEADFARFGEETDARVRAERLDEGLEILTGLWSGEQFSFSGRHFALRDVRFLPPPVQSPRPPVWVAAGWPNRAPLRRAARWDGVFPIPRDFTNGPELAVQDIEQLAGVMAVERRDDSRFDIVVGGYTGGMTASVAAAHVDAYAAAGATWWMESDGPETPLAVLRERVRTGPPCGG